MFTSLLSAFYVNLNRATCVMREIGRFKISGAVLDVVFPQTLLSIDPTTDFLGMLVLRCETNLFDRFFANLENCQKKRK